MSRVLYPLWETRVRGRPTLAHLSELERTQWASPDELRDLQRGALAALLEHARENVPFYRARFDAAGLAPHDIDGPEDLARLPILTRAAAQAAGDARVSTAPPRPTIEKTTGGTTGEPLVIRYDVGSEHWRQAVKLRGFGWAGYRVGVPSLHYWGEPTRARSLAARAKIALDRGLKRETYVDCTPRGEDHLRAVVDTIRRVKPAVLLCYAQAGADLARWINASGCRDWDTIAVLTGAERLFPDDRAALEQAFGPAVFETYGCREFMLIASECPAHDGLHMSAENLIVEVVVRDGDGERPAAPGEVGEVVITDLHNFGMPFIRYANGDLATPAEAGACRCGRALPRLSSVEGRSTETLTDGDGNRVGGMVFNLVFSPLSGSVRQFQAVQHRDRSITLKVVPAPGFDEGALAHVHDRCARYLPGVDVTTEIVDDIPLTRSGKRRVVIVET